MTKRVLEPKRGKTMDLRNLGVGVREVAIPQGWRVFGGHGDPPKRQVTHDDLLDRS